MFATLLVMHIAVRIGMQHAKRTQSNFVMALRVQMFQLKGVNHKDKCTHSNVNGKDHLENNHLIASQDHHIGGNSASRSLYRNRVNMWLSKVKSQFHI